MEGSYDTVVDEIPTIVDAPGPLMDPKDLNFALPKPLYYFGTTILSHRERWHRIPAVKTHLHTCR